MTGYDVIVVGARCAGSPTAMLLARAGQRVLLVDRATFPSDTVSTHFIHPPGVAALRRWGLLDRLAATGCPPVTRYRYDFGPFVVAGCPLPTADGVSTGYGPRRTVLDSMLLEAAAEAGVEVREGFAVKDVLVEGGRVVGVLGEDPRSRAGLVEERADLVVGADGRRSVVAQAVAACVSRTHAPYSVGYFAYWRDLPVDDLDLHLRPRRAVMAFGTNDDLTCLVVAAAHADLPLFRRDLEGSYAAGLATVPEYADRTADARRESRILGMAVPSFWRQAWGPGWALAGDARCDRDPCTAQGITSAFLDAEALTDAWTGFRSGRWAHDEAMARFGLDREAQSLPMYELTCELATLEPPPPERARLLEAVSRTEHASQRFVSMIAGTVAVPDFFGGLSEPAAAGPGG